MPEPVNTALDDARKRARRRLVGAIVLALAAAVVVPVFLESDPKPLGPDVQIQIPAVDDSKFQNRLTPPVKGGTLDKGATPDKGAADSAKAAAPAGSQGTKDVPALPRNDTASASGNSPVSPPIAGASSPSDASPAATSTPQTAPLPAPADAQGTAAKTAPAVESTKADKDPKAASKPPDKGSEKSSEKASDKNAAKAAKAPDKAAEKTAAADKARDKPVPAKAPPEPPHTLGTATLNTSPPAAPAKGGDFVVQLGAFVDKAVATDLAAKAGEQGYPVFLEPVTTKSGTVQRVRVGPFASRDAADAAAAKLAAAGFTAVARPR